MNVHNTPTITRTKDSINWLGIATIVIVVVLGIITLYITADEVLTPKQQAVKEERCGTIGKLAKVVIAIKAKDKSLEQILNRLNQRDPKSVEVVTSAYGMINDKEFLKSYDPNKGLGEQVEQTMIARCLKK